MPADLAERRQAMSDVDAKFEPNTGRREHFTDYKRFAVLTVFRVEDGSLHRGDFRPARHPVRTHLDEQQRPVVSCAKARFEWHFEAHLQLAQG